MRANRLAALLLTSILSACAMVAAPSSDGVDPERAIARVTCGGGASFPVELLDEPGEAESANDPAADALRRHLATDGPDYEWLPDAGWREAVRTEESVMFIADAPPGDGAPLVALSAERQAEGWKVTSWGDCWPQASVGPDLVSAEFRVAPHEELTEATNEIDVLVMERACNSGEDARGRIEAHAVIPGPKSVVAILAVRPRGGMHTCQGNPETPFVLELPEPLGDRELLDGSSFPARDATSCPDYLTCP